MARKVFYSFHYDKDIMRVMTVINRWVTKGGKMASEIIDKVEFEKIKKDGDKAVKNWINEQMEGTSVTVVLLGEDTLQRPFVQYEICKSIERGNAIIGVHISGIIDARTKNTAHKANVHEVIGYYADKIPAYFDKVCDGIFDYTYEDGYNNLGKWVEEMANKKGK